MAHTQALRYKLPPYLHHDGEPLDSLFDMSLYFASITPGLDFASSMPLRILLSIAIFPWLVLWVGLRVAHVLD
jgi:hypothetical protein